MNNKNVIDEGMFIVIYDIYDPGHNAVTDINIMLPTRLTIGEKLESIIYRLIPKHEEDWEVLEYDVDWGKCRHDHCKFIVYSYSENLLLEMKTYISNNREHYFHGYRFVFRGVYYSCEEDIKEPEE